MFLNQQQADYLEFVTEADHALESDLWMREMSDEGDDEILLSDEDITLVSSDDDEDDV